MTEITTINEYRKAVTNVREVLAQVRFGTSERWVRITKADALLLVKGMARDATPDDAEMYYGVFGNVDDDINVLYVG